MGRQVRGGPTAVFRASQPAPSRPVLWRSATPPALPEAFSRPPRETSSSSAIAPVRRWHVVASGLAGGFRRHATINSMSEAAAIQCSTGSFWTFELEEAFDVVAEAGFKEIELMVTRDPSTHEPDLPLKLTAERGLRIRSIHAPFLVITKTVWGLDPVEKIQRGREMCAALGCETMIVHPPYLWERAYTRWLKHECRDFCSESGITVAVETMYPRWVAGRRLRAYKWLDVSELVASVPYVALDTSHVTVARHDILDAYSVVAPKLHHIHLSDNAGDGRDGHLEFGQGILPIERFLTELRQTEYGGVVSLELSLRHYVENRAGLVSMLRRNREYIEERLKRDPRIPKGMPRSEQVS